jgi:hypothetical protein
MTQQILNFTDPRHERLFGDVSPKLLEKFKQFHSDNPQIYEAFKRFSFEIKGSGRTKYSHWAVANRVRWHFDTQIAGDYEFKISNNYITVLARMLIWNHPEFEGFFSLRHCNPNAGYGGARPKPKGRQHASAAP